MARTLLSISRMAKPEEAALERILALSDEMLALADSDALAGADVAIGIVLGTLRDSGYNLRRLAERELDRRRPAPDPRANACKPPSSAPDAPARPSPDPHDGEAARRVLVVEDDPDTRTFLRAWFEDRGYAVTTASDGVGAVELAARIRPDLVTLDLSMPERSGLEVLRQLRDLRELASVPVIVITAVGDGPGSLAGASGPLRVDGLLRKPVDLSDLSGMVRKLVD